VSALRVAFVFASRGIAAGATMPEFLGGREGMAHPASGGERE
jgi:hypothetical protein